MAGAEIRNYRQFKDVAVKENGSIMQSDRMDNMFECTYRVDRAKKIITRTKVRRLDDPSGRKDLIIYRIKQETDLLGSEAGNGGKVLIAVRDDGGEILEMGRGFAYTMRISPFSIVITGVYRRVFNDGQKPPLPDNAMDRSSHRPQRPQKP